jgi:hypothetical protein
MTRSCPTRLRNAIAPAIVVLFVASLFGITRGVEHVNEHTAFERVAVSAANAPSHATSLAGRSQLTSSHIVTARPSLGSLVVTDAFLLGAALALTADLYRRRFDARLRERLRSGAVFVRRRGPPALHLAR